MPADLGGIVLLAGLAIALVIIPALAMAGYLSDLERQAEIETALWRARQAEEPLTPQDASWQPDE